MLDGRVGVILDSGGGTGRETALLMAREGARVVVNDAGGSAGETEPGAFAMEGVVRAVQESGGEALACAEPVASWDGAHRLMQTAVDRFGRIDIVVNNVALAPLDERSMIDEISEEAWQTALRSRLKATFCCTRAALPHMRSQRQGCFLYFLPAAGLLGTAGQSHEGAVVTAIAGFSRNVAIEMERVPVISNCIVLHSLAYGMPAPAGGPARERGEGEENTDGPDKLRSEAAPLAVFLAGDAASGISGQLFGVRGREIYLLSQSRIARSIHHSQGWTVEGLADMIEPGMGTSFTSLQDVDSCFSWDVME
jgi:NAD(P)-dependent dehydrogenase (short-subunit alcohol dehydrogenase family)